jgi:hypothetical protein
MTAPGIKKIAAATILAEIGEKPVKRPERLGHQVSLRPVAA